MAEEIVIDLADFEKRPNHWFRQALSKHVIVKNGVRREFVLVAPSEYDRMKENEERVSLE